jgi:hypothetical protein
MWNFTDASSERANGIHQPVPESHDERDGAERDAQTQDVQEHDGNPTRITEKETPMLKETGGPLRK